MKAFKSYLLTASASTIALTLFALSCSPVQASKKVTEDQVKEILRETLELEDVEEAEYEAETQLLKIVTKDNQFAGVMTRVVNICSRIGKGAELSFAKFFIEG